MIRRKAKCLCMIALFQCVVLITFVLRASHISYIRHNVESPYEHWISGIQAVFYLLRCPNFDGVDAEKANTFLHKPVSEAGSTFPRVTMISARPKDQTKLARDSWTSASHVYNFTFTIVDTHDISVAFKSNDGALMSLCRNYLHSIGFDNLRDFQLNHPAVGFAVHRKVFEDTLKQFPDDDFFLFVEDDAVLLDAAQMMKEAALVIRNRLQFYSFYFTPQQNLFGMRTCLFHWGTQSFLMHRELMQSIITTPPVYICGRMALDIFLAMKGPWFATTSDIVLHVGKRYEVS